MPRKLLFFSKNRKIEWERLLETEPFFGPRMASLYRAQGFIPDADYWVGHHGALMRYFGTLYLIGEPSAVDEFLYTIDRNPLWAGIEGPSELIHPIAEALSLFSYRHAPCMLHDDQTFLSTDGYDIRKSENLKLFYEFLSICHEGFGDHTSYPLWYQDYAARIGCEVTELYFLYEKDKPVACATLNVQNFSHAILGSVSTLPAFRGRGYGKIISSFVTRRIHEKGLIAGLQCHEESLVNFYAPLGYHTAGEWASAERE